MGTSNPEPPLCYPVKEAARLLGLGRTTVYKLLKSGELKSVRDCGRRLVPRDALLEYDARRKAAAGWDAPNAVGGPRERADGPKPAAGARAAVPAHRARKRGDDEWRVVGRSGVPLADDPTKHPGGRGGAVGASGVIRLDSLEEFVRSRWGANATVEVTMRPHQGRCAV